MNDAQPATAALVTVEDVEEAMRDVVDPELGINVVDLGLVYGIRIDDMPPAPPAGDAETAGGVEGAGGGTGGNGKVVTIDMTLTSAACPLTDVIEDQARAALTGGPGGGLAQDFRINWVWMPPWGPDKITDEGREQLRALGFNV